MILALLLAATTVDPSSHFMGEWKCSSPFTDMPFMLDLKTASIDGTMKVEIFNSNDQRLPDGPIRVVGPAEVMKKTYEWEKDSEFMPDARQDLIVDNSTGHVDFLMFWDKDDGVSVNLWQYYKDRSPSHFMGGLVCKAKPK
jgi:hypothetical protein